MIITKKERSQKVFEYFREKAGEGLLRSMGRFVYHYQTNGGRSHYLVLAYKGAVERFLISKYLVIQNPEVISDDWLETNKDKFQESGDNYLISPEFKNFPFFGLVPFRIMRRLGNDVSHVEEGGLNILYNRCSQDYTSLAKSGLPRGFKSLVKT